MQKKKICLVFLVMVFALATVFSQKIPLQFNRNKKFKIVQFTDVHYLPGHPDSEMPLKTMVAVLDAEKPDLVVFTGDIVTGPPAEQGWKIVLKPLNDLKIPYAIVLGNHDDESDLTREQVAAVIEPAPYGLFVTKAADITGFGNYVLPVKASSGNKTAALLYCFDSNAYNHRDTMGGYDWIQPDQIEWYKKESENQTRLNNGKKLPALAFFHIPLPEHRQAYMNEQYPPIGLHLETECSPYYNSGLFGTMVKCGDVKGVFTGHDHNNDYIAYKDGIALAYGRFTGGKATYGDLESGARIIELTEGVSGFTTWLRTRSGNIYCRVKFPLDFTGK